MRYLLIILVFSFLGNVALVAFNDDEAKTSSQSNSAGVELETNKSVISVASLEINAPIIFLDSTNESYIQEALQNGVVHYTGTALPGEVGNSYMVGHSSDLPWNEGEYKNVFSQLPELTIDDKVNIYYKGNEYIYEVVETKIVEADDLSVLDQPFDQKLLTLQTSYPIGTAQKRFIVVSKLIE